MNIAHIESKLTLYKELKEIPSGHRDEIEKLQVESFPRVLKNEVQDLLATMIGCSIKSDRHRMGTLAYKILVELDIKSESIEKKIMEMIDSDHENDRRKIANCLVNLMEVLIK